MSTTSGADDSVEVHYGEEPGMLRLSCGAKAFARLRDAVFADLGDEYDVPKGDVRLIEIESIRRQSARPVGHRLMSAGCILAGTAAALILVVGVVTIGKWILAAF